MIPPQAFRSARFYSRFSSRFILWRADKERRFSLLITFRSETYWSTKMWVIRTITARTFLWLAAMAIPFQGLPSATCGCTSVDRWIETSSSCCQQELACCSVDTSSESGCQCSTGCQCGDNCQCSVSSHAPSEPVVPPFESNSPERILTNSVETATLVAFRLPSATRQHTDSYVGANARTALDCCVALCRFTL